MKKRAVLSGLCSVVGVFIVFGGNVAWPFSGSDGARKGHSTIMLILGSSNPGTREARVGLACDLLKKGDIHFDTVILSGGCGAHGTDASNCEATDMKRLLETVCTDDISGLGIYKEESSRSTVQNYCNSVALEVQGQKLIQKPATLYVVSSHYHALSVAACFGNKGVDAHYYYTCAGRLYEGTAPPLATVAGSTTPCYRDYTDIARKCGTPELCESQPGR